MLFLISPKREIVYSLSFLITIDWRVVFFIFSNPIYSKVDKNLQIEPMIDTKFSESPMQLLESMWNRIETSRVGLELQIMAFIPSGQIIHFNWICSLKLYKKWGLFLPSLSFAVCTSRLSCSEYSCGEKTYCKSGGLWNGTGCIKRWRVH